MLVEVIIQNWLNDLNYKSPVMIKKSYNNSEVTIFTTHPGILIGKGGQSYNALKDELQKHKWNLKLQEADEIICPCNATIDTRKWEEIADERARARMEMWGL